MSSESHATEIQAEALGARTQKLHILGPSEAGECSFWVAFYKSGPNSVSSYSNNVESLEQKIGNAATKGFAEDGPVMITDVSENERYYLLLLPVDLSYELDFSNVAEQIKGWRPKQLGIYFDERFYGKEAMRECLGKIFNKVGSNDEISDFYFFTSKGGYSLTLEALNEIRETSQKHLEIFH